MAYARGPVSTLRQPLLPPDDGLADARETPANSSAWFSSFISLQAETLSTCLSALSSPLLSLFSVPPEPQEKAAELAADGGGSGAGAGLLLRRVGVGILAAVYVGMILTILLTAAAVLGVGAVRLWVEEPVLMRERLSFDYTDPNPKAVFSFDHEGGFEGHSSNFVGKSKKMGVPVGHTFYVSLVLVMPESYYNREIGIFQVAAELISDTGDVMTRSSLPTMLQYRSQPIRIIQELIWCVPLLLGITTETERIVIPILRHKEGHPRTKAIRVILMPRAGTAALPQLYEAEIILKSHLPWMKEVLYRWKWTLYVWATLYIYVALLVVSLCCFRPLVVPVLTKSVSGTYPNDEASEPSEEKEERNREGRNASESMKRRRMSRSRKKQAMLLQQAEPEEVDSSASSYTITREEDIAPPLEETEDSESVCFRSGGEE